MNPEFFSPEQVAIQEAAIRAQTARGLEDAQAQMQEQLAARGLSGGIGAFQQARLQQQAARQSQDELSRLAIENRARTVDERRQTLADLRSAAEAEEARRIAIGQMMADVLMAERGPIDLQSAKKPKE